MLSAGIKNVPLTKYLIEQVFLTEEDRFAELLKFYPEAQIKDWETVQAGQRVQIIKKDKEEGGVLKFGTEIVSDQFGSIAALLGASPGASTSVSIMLNLLQKCFPENWESRFWQDKLKKMVPSLNVKLNEQPEMLQIIREMTSRKLGLGFSDE